MVPASCDVVIVVPNHDVLLHRHDPVHVIGGCVVHGCDNCPVLITLDHVVLHRYHGERLSCVPVCVGERCLGNCVIAGVFDDEVCAERGVDR